MLGYARCLRGCCRILPGRRRRTGGDSEADPETPFVWVDIRPDASTGILLDLIVGNSGSPMAKTWKAVAAGWSGASTAAGQGHGAALLTVVDRD